jgi:hypothetical protein
MPLLREQRINPEKQIDPTSILFRRHQNIVFNAGIDPGQGSREGPWGLQARPQYWGDDGQSPPANKALSVWARDPKIQPIPDHREGPSSLWTR